MRAGARDPCARSETEGVVLDLPVAEPNPEDEPAAGDDIQRGGLLGELNRIHEGQQVDGHPDPHRSGVGGQARRRHRGLQHLELSGQKVLAKQHQVKPEIARQPHLLDRFPPALGSRLVGRMLVRHEEPELGGHGPHLTPAQPGRAAIRIRSLMCYHVLHEESSTRSRRP